MVEPVAKPVAEVAAPSIWHRLGDRSVLVFDDLFSEEFIEAIGIMALRLNYRRSPGYNEQLHYNLEDEFYLRIPIFPKTIAALGAHYKHELGAGDVELKVFHAYAASLRYGDFALGHTDCESPKCLTFLYYANLHWDSDWGGETLFYDRAWDARFAVTPRPGRLILFHANLNHRTGIPLRDCPHSRLTLSVFLRDHENFLARTFEDDSDGDSGEERWARLEAI